MCSARTNAARGPKRRHKSAHDARHTFRWTGLRCATSMKPRVRFQRHSAWIFLRSAHTAPKRFGRPESTDSKKRAFQPTGVRSDVNTPCTTSTMSPHMPMVCVWKCVGPSVHVVNRLDGRSCCTSIYQPCTHGAKSAQTRRRAPHPTAGSRSTHKTGPRNTCRGPRMRGIQPATERRAGGRHGCGGVCGSGSGGL